MASKLTISKILHHFPPGCSYCFAYGSGVFLQKNQKPGKMVDLIFIVDDPLKWHTQNLEMNRSHYSGIRVFGPQLIADIQERMACGIYYNPFVKVDETLVKYGVMSTAALENDLINWKHIYVAGRLHKPVLDLVGPTTKQLHSALLKNRESALKTSLLLNSRCMRKTDLYHTITEISYMGDFRMKFGEHPDKVKNIVTPLVPYFDQIYSPLIEKLNPYVKVDKNGIITQDIDPNGRLQQLMGLPYPIQRSLARRIYRDPRNWDVEDAMVELSHVPNVAPFIRQSIMDVVWGASIRQTVQGVISAGVIRSIRYGFEKVMKKVTAKKTLETTTTIKDDLLEENSDSASSDSVLLIEPSPNPKPPIEDVPVVSTNAKELVLISENETTEEELKKLGRKPRKSAKEENTDRNPKRKTSNNNNNNNTNNNNNNNNNSNSSSSSANPKYKRVNMHKHSEMNEA